MKNSLTHFVQHSPKFYSIQKVQTLPSVFDPSHLWRDRALVFKSSNMSYEKSQNSTCATITELRFWLRHFTHPLSASLVQIWLLRQSTVVSKRSNASKCETHVSSPNLMYVAPTLKTRGYKIAQWKMGRENVLNLAARATARTKSVSSVGSQLESELDIWLRHFAHPCKPGRESWLNHH